MTRPSRPYLVVNDVAWFGEKPGYRDSDHFLIDGTSGFVQKVDDTSLALLSRQTGDDTVIQSFSPEDHALTFGYSMKDLQRAVLENTEPSVSGRRNLETMRTVFAACRSADEGRVVPLAEIAGEQE